MSPYEGLIKVICCLLVFFDRQKSTSSYFVFHVNIFFLKGILCEHVIWFYGTTWRLWECGSLCNFTKDFLGTSIGV